jgi:hypothetical protein
VTNCETCGRPAENGQETHWLGCAEAKKPKAPEADDSMVVTDRGVVPAGCAFGDCGEDRKPWSGKGAKPKYCEEHSDPKNRK